MDIGFGRTEPPKKSISEVAQFVPIMSPFEAFRGPKRCFRGAFGLKTIGSTDIDLDSKASS